MRRLPPLREPELDESQRLLWHDVTGGRRAAAHQGGGGLTDVQGGLIGPFNAWLYSPGVGLQAARLGEAVRFDTTLDRRTLELAILTVATHWRCNFETWAHRGFALAAGAEPDLVEGVIAGGDVRPTDPDDAVVVDFCRELVSTGRVDDHRWDEAVGRLGTAGVVDLVTTVGYYTLVAFNLNVFRVGLPEGQQLLWDE